MCRRAGCHPPPGESEQATWSTRSARSRVETIARARSSAIPNLLSLLPVIVEALDRIFDPVDVFRHSRLGHIPPVIRVCRAKPIQVVGKLSDTRAGVGQLGLARAVGLDLL